MSSQEMYGSRGPWGQTAVLQLTYELRPKWNNNKENKNENEKNEKENMYPMTRFILVVN